jgi:hypothetical protein
LHLLDQRIENYALFPEVSPQMASAQRCGHDAPADRVGPNLVGLTTRAEGKVIDKIVAGLKFHSQRMNR